MKIKRGSVFDTEILILLLLCLGEYYLYQVNVVYDPLYVSGGHLYRNLDLIKPEDQKDYKKLINDRSQILEYQSSTSSGVTHFIEVIEEDLLKQCKKSGKNYSYKAHQENILCISRYISNLYGKLKIEDRIISDYKGRDPILISYNKDLGGSHPFIRYFLDFYDHVSSTTSIARVTYLENPFQFQENENISESQGNRAGESEGYYTYSNKNIQNYLGTQTIQGTKNGIVVNANMLTRLKNIYGYVFPNGAITKLGSTWPGGGEFVYHETKGDKEYLYQIIGPGAGSGEYYLLVWVFEEGYRIPVGECGYCIDTTTPLCQKCENRVYDNITSMFLLGEDTYELADIDYLSKSFATFLKALEQTRVLSR